jgi:hypothetical protein
MNWIKQFLSLAGNCEPLDYFTLFSQIAGITVCCGIFDLYNIQGSQLIEVFMTPLLL